SRPRRADAASPPWPTSKALHGARLVPRRGTRNVPPQRPWLWADKPGTIRRSLWHNRHRRWTEPKDGPTGSPAGSCSCWIRLLARRRADSEWPLRHVPWNDAGNGARERLIAGKSSRSTGPFFHRGGWELLHGSAKLLKRQGIMKTADFAKALILLDTAHIHAITPHRATAGSPVRSKEVRS